VTAAAGKREAMAPSLLDPFLKMLPPPEDEENVAPDQEIEPPARPEPLRRAAEAAKNVNTDPRLLVALKMMRELLPGDSRYGDPLSTAGDTEGPVIGRRLAEVTAERPGLLREAGLTALQVWQGVAKSEGDTRGDQPVAIAFTDLAEFSSWALQAGDTAALTLLRDVAEAIEPPVRANRGVVVKRLGDGMMAVFDDPARGLDAILEARRRLAEVEAPGYDARIRAGLHVGRPRELGGDYFGVDVNVAARVAESAGADEVLISGQALELLDGLELKVRRKRFRAKGVPEGVSVYAVKAAG
jgi:adenylate cyclase